MSLKTPEGVKVGGKGTNFHVPLPLGGLLFLYPWPFLRVRVLRGRGYWSLTACVPLWAYHILSGPLGHSLHMYFFFFSFLAPQSLSLPDWGYTYIRLFLFLTEAHHLFTVRCYRGKGTFFWPWGYPCQSLGKFNTIFTMHFTLRSLYSTVLNLDFKCSLCG